MRSRLAFDWRTIAALNAVSALAQIGQFGFALVMVPVWLAQQGLDASQLGLFAASLWLGQLPGLAMAPQLCRRWGERWVIGLGLLCTVSAFVWIAFLGWPYGLMGGMLSGFGLGLRWIGVEPWLYRIAPPEARGRLVGFHETLIALAPILAPLMANAFGMQGNTVFWIGTAFTLGALLPLALARTPPDALASAPAKGQWMRQLSASREQVFKQGVVIASVGGMTEGAVSGLFALFAQSHGMGLSQTAELLAVFGLGGLLMQYGMGWLADHQGVGRAALVCAAGTAATSIALVFSTAYPLMLCAVFLLGGCITAFLTLALIAGTLARTGSMAGNLSLISMVYALSGVLGPLVSGPLMEARGGNALMWFTAAAALLMVCLLVRLPNTVAQTMGSKTD